MVKRYPESGQDLPENILIFHTYFELLSGRNAFRSHNIECQREIIGRNLRGGFLFKGGGQFSQRILHRGRKNPHWRVHGQYYHAERLFLYLARPYVAYIHRIYLLVVAARKYRTVWQKQAHGYVFQEIV